MLGQCQNNSIFSIINFSTLHFSKSLIFDMRYFIVKICGNLVLKKIDFLDNHKFDASLCLLKIRQRKHSVV